MAKVNDITVLNVDGVPYAVDACSQEVKDLVEIYNDWNKKEVEVRDELLRFQAAKETLSHQIIGKLREQLDMEAAAKLKAEQDAAESAAAAAANESA